jgi:hypothetical protein
MLRTLLTCAATGLLVVGCAGNQPRPEGHQEPLDRILLAVDSRLERLFVWLLCLVRRFVCPPVNILCQ